MSVVGKVVGGLVVAAVTVGAIYLTISVYDLLNYCYKMAGYKFKGFTDENGKSLSTFDVLGSLVSGKKIFGNIELYINLTNASSLSVGISGYSINVTLNGVPVSAIKSTTPQVLKANSVTMITIPVKVDFSKVTTALKDNSLITNFSNQQYDKIIFGFTGNFSGTLLGIHVNKGLSMQYSLKDIQAAMDAPTDPSAIKC
jgi:hypothetical protein